MRIARTNTLMNLPKLLLYTIMITETSKTLFKRGAQKLDLETTVINKNNYEDEINKRNSEIIGGTPQGNIYPERHILHKINIKSKRKVRKLKLHKNIVPYDIPPLIKEKDIIKPMQSTNNRSNMNKSMLHTDQNFNRQLIMSEEKNSSSNHRAILAMSRRSKLKDGRNFITAKGGSKMRFYKRNSSRRSNSVNSNRTGRSSSSKRSMSNRKFKRSHNKSKSRLRGRKYLKNILPIVGSQEGNERGEIARRFDSASRVEHQLSNKLQT